MKFSTLLIFSTLASYSVSQPNLSNGMKSFHYPDFRFDYPDSWTIDTSGAWGAEVNVFSPVVNEEDNFSENVNVLIQNLEGQPIGLEQYKQITEQQITDLATDGHIIESLIDTRNERAGYRITYTMTQGIFKLKITSVCFILHDKAYLVTFCSVLDQYEQYKNMGEQILDSFTLIE